MAKFRDAIRSTACAGMLALWAGASWAADIPEPVKKLTGSSDDTARAVMAQQGYALRSEKSSWGRTYRYWWSDKARQCVQLMSLSGRIAQVQAKGESDCKPGAVAALPGASAPGAALDPATLVGLPRRVADDRLAAAGFNAINTDMSKGETIYIWWSNGRQCLAGNIAADRYELLQTMPPKDCGIK